MNCPKCGKVVIPKNTRYGPRHGCCDVWSWDGAEMVNEETHEARKAAHSAFDELWKSKLFKRGDAYKELAKELGIPEEQCHMKLMDAETASRVPLIALKLKFRHAT